MRTTHRGTGGSVPTCLCKSWRLTWHYYNIITASVGPTRGSINGLSSSPQEEERSDSTHASHSCHRSSSSSPVSSSLSLSVWLALMFSFDQIHRHLIASLASKSLFRKIRNKKKIEKSSFQINGSDWVYSVNRF